MTIDSIASRLPKLLLGIIAAVASTACTDVSDHLFYRLRNDSSHTIEVEVLAGSFDFHATLSPGDDTAFCDGYSGDFGVNVPYATEYRLCFDDSVEYFGGDSADPLNPHTLISRSNFEGGSSGAGKQRYTYTYTFTDADYDYAVEHCEK